MPLPLLYLKFITFEHNKSTITDARFLHADKENFSDEELMQEEQIRPQSFKDFAGQKNVG